jgi:hypothetical protein
VTKNKKAGTYRETWVKQRLLDAGLDAERAGNNMPSKDVALRVASRRYAVEVKDRRNLNLHQTVKDTIDQNAGERAVVVWHKREAAGQSGRLMPVGPTLAALPFDTFVTIMAELEAASRRIELLERTIVKMATRKFNQ